LVWVLLFCLYGFLRGAVAQVIGLLGWIAGLWVSLWVAHGLSVYWHAADPALAYRVLRWIVAGLAGLAVVSLFQWLGETLGRMVRSGPAGWVDRGSGLAVGAVLGLITAALLVMATLLVPTPRGVSRSVAEARVTEPLMARASQACSLSAGWMPGATWLTHHFRKAHRRMLVLRAGEAKTKS
jgi:uncharacterized membrane protein required for colicin V production